MESEGTVPVPRTAPALWEGAGITFSAGITGIDRKGYFDTDD